MNARFLSTLIIVPFALAVLSGCTADAVTDSLSINFGEITVAVEKAGSQATLNGSITVRMVNLTEKQMNVGFLEGELIDASTGEALVRFRPIIPESYGSISTARLLPKETRDIPVILPLGLEAFDAARHPRVVVGLFLQTTDGYRTGVKSLPVVVTSK